MNRVRAGRTGLLAALCAAIFSTAALAGAGVRDETTLLVRTSAGAIERLAFEGELADGERRALSTVAGNPATLSRSGAGLLLELAGERFDVKLPEVEIDDAGTVAVAGDEAERRIVIHTKGAAPASADAPSSAEPRKVVKIVRRGEGAEGEAAQAEMSAMALAGGDPEVLLLEGEGPRVLVMRRIVHGDGTP